MGHSTQKLTIAIVYTQTHTYTHTCTHARTLWQTEGERRWVPVWVSLIARRLQQCWLGTRDLGAFWVPHNNVWDLKLNNCLKIQNGNTQRKWIKVKSPAIQLTHKCYLKLFFNGNSTRVIQAMVCWHKRAYLCILAPARTSCVVLGKWLSLSVPAPHL